MTLEAKKEGTIANFTKNPIATVSDPMGFNKKILEARTGHFHDAARSGESFVFYDRGIPDVIAYMDYFKQEYGDEFVVPCQQLRYDIVLLLPMWEGIYVSDNERFESYEDALSIHHHLWEAYLRLGYEVIEVPKDSVRNRIRFILETIKQL